MYAAVDTDSELLLEVGVFNHRGVSPAAAFLHRLTKKHDIAEAVILVDAGSYLTAPSCPELSGRFDYRIRNRIEMWFQTLTMRIDRFHTFWRGSQSSAEQ